MRNSDRSWYILVCYFFKAFLLLYFCLLFFLRHRLASGTSEKIQLGSLLAAFQVARDMVAKSVDDEDKDR
jgi:hypothetical protein